MKVRIPNEFGNDLLKDPKFGPNMKTLLSDAKAEAAYFSTFDGCRGAYVIVNLEDASQMPAIAEPFFVALKAKVDFYPVMTLEDLAKAGPAIEAAFKKWA